MASKESLYLIKIIATQQGVQQVKQSLKEIDGITKTSTQSLKTATTKQNDFVKALKRVAIVVPVWFVFRQAMMAVFRTFSEGLQYWVEFDRALQKSKQVIHDYTGTMGEAVVELTERTKNLSIETGESMAKLQSAFYRFGTVGLNIKTSMQGMETATRLATVMFGDADQTARVLAQAYRLLGDSINKTIPESKRLEVTGAQIYKLWRTNAFELNEFTGALQQFLPTANVFNFNMEQTISLLATLETAGLKGSRAGRLLRTSINKLVQNLDQATKMLGIKFNPEVDNAYLALMKVLEAVNRLKNEGKPIQAIVETMGIFGGVRSKEAGMALIALYDTLLKNQKDINTEIQDYNKLLDEQKEKYDEVLASVSGQIKIMKNLTKVSSQNFVQGVAGGKDFAEALKNINDLLTDLEKHAKILGSLFARLLVPHFPVGEFYLQYFKDPVDIVEGFKRALSKEWKARIGLGFGFGNVPLGIKWEKIKKEDQDKIINEVDTFIEDLNKTVGAKSIKITPKFIFRTKEEIKELELIIRHELDLLKLRGASESKILEAENILKSQLRLQEDTLSPLKRQLDLEKAITREKIEQNSYSKDAIELYKIAIERVEQYQAGRWYREEAPRNMPIPGGMPRINIAEIMRDIARIRPVEALRVQARPEIPTAIPPIALNQNIDLVVELDGKPIEGRTRVVIKNDIEDPNSILSKGINEKIEEY